MMGDQATASGGTGAAREIAAVLIEGFDKHYGLFRATSARAADLFDAGDWTEWPEEVRVREMPGPETHPPGRTLVGRATDPQAV